MVVEILKVPEKVLDMPLWVGKELVGVKLQAHSSDAGVLVETKTLVKALSFKSQGAARCIYARTPPGILHFVFKPDEVKIISL